AREFLWAERERARAAIQTDYCVGKVCHVCGVPPSLCFALKRDMGLLGSRKNAILAMDEGGVTRGLSGVDEAAPRRLRSASPGPVRAPRRPAATPAAEKAAPGAGACD